MEIETLIVGASAAGLATAACLKRAGKEAVCLEAAPSVGAAWRQHYDRLHLHTPKGASSLPFLPFPAEVPRYASRPQVVEYLERYAAHHGLAPRFGEPALAIERHDGGWSTRTARAEYRSRNVVVATGLTRVPHRPTWLGEASFTGTILHSSTYRNGEPWRDRRALVIGFGNSAGEIALDLHEHGAQVALSVRGPVNVIPRELLGLPILSVGRMLSWLPPRAADVLGRPLVALKVGDTRKLGLARPPYGPMEQIHRDGQVPLIDIGTVAAIRAGHVRVHGGVERFTERGVTFADGSEASFDVVVAATGYRPRLFDFLKDAAAYCDEDGTPRTSGAEAAPGLYFCGFKVTPIGHLRQIGVEARQIARALTRAPSAR